MERLSTYLKRLMLWQQLKLTPGTLFSSADRRQKAMIMSGQRYHFPIHDAIQFQGQSAFKESKMAFAGSLGGCFGASI